jgi:hypothetical protein
MSVSASDLRHTSSKHVLLNIKLLRAGLYICTPKNVCLGNRSFHIHVAILLETQAMHCISTTIPW